MFLKREMSPRQKKRCFSMCIQVWKISHLRLALTIELEKKGKCEYIISTNSFGYLVNDERTTVVEEDVRS